MIGVSLNHYYIYKNFKELLYRKLADTELEVTHNELTLSLFDLYLKIVSFF